MKSAFGNLNARLTKLALLKLYFSNATISSARSVPLIPDMRPAPLYYTWDSEGLCFSSIATQM